MPSPIVDLPLHVSWSHVWGTRPSFGGEQESDAPCCRSLLFSYHQEHRETAYHDDDQYWSRLAWRYSELYRVLFELFLGLSRDHDDGVWELALC